MAKVLITGASGFIGFHLIRALVERGEEVTAMDRRPPSLWEPDRLGVRFRGGDVLDAKDMAAAVAGQSLVYHLAGCVAARRAAEFHRVNGEGMAAVCAACARQETPPGLVALSSMAAIGPTRNGRPSEEGDPAAPVSHYGRSKRAGELAAEAWGDRARSRSCVRRSSSARPIRIACRSIAR